VPPFTCSQQTQTQTQTMMLSCYLFSVFSETWLFRATTEHKEVTFITLLGFDLFQHKNPQPPAPDPDSYPLQ